MERWTKARLVARWPLAYRGSADLPPAGAYRAAGSYLTLADSGRPPRGPEFRALRPLVDAAGHDAAFGLEAGPLTTWSN